MNTKSGEARAARPRMLVVLRDAYLDSLPGLMSLLEFMTEAGWDVSVLSVQEPGFLPPTEWPGIRIAAVSGGRRIGPLRVRVPVTLALAWAAFRERRRWRPHVVLSGGVLGVAAARAAVWGSAVCRVQFVIELPRDPAVPAKGGFHSTGLARRAWSAFHGWVSRVIERVDVAAMREADMVIVQDQHRGHFLVERIGIDPRRLALLPNARRGGVCRKESHWLRHRFGIPAAQRIALHSGGLGAWCQSLELVESATRWPERWRLVLHTRLRPETGVPYFDEVRRAAEAAGVCLSLEPVPAATLDELISSADVGIALYADRNGPAANLMGLASGKIGNYLKCGLPVISTGLPTVRDFVEHYQCGVCIDAVEEIPAALERIDADYARYRQNAFRCYEELFDPEPRCGEIDRRMRGLAALALPSNGSGSLT